MDVDQVPAHPATGGRYGSNDAVPDQLLVQHSRPETHEERYTARQPLPVARCQCLRRTVRRVPNEEVHVAFTVGHDFVDDAAGAQPIGPNVGIEEGRAPPLVGLDAAATLSEERLRVQAVPQRALAVVDEDTGLGSRNHEQAILRDETDHREFRVAAQLQSMPAVPRRQETPRAASSVLDQPGGVRRPGIVVRTDQTDRRGQRTPPVQVAQVLQVRQRVDPILGRQVDAGEQVTERHSVG